MADKGKPERAAEQAGENVEESGADVPNIEVSEVASGSNTRHLELMAADEYQRSKRALSRSPDASKSPIKEGDEKAAKHSKSFTRIGQLGADLVDAFKYGGKKDYVDEEKQNLCEEEYLANPRVYPVLPEMDSGFTSTPPVGPVATNPDYQLSNVEKPSVSSALSDYSSVAEEVSLADDAFNPDFSANIDDMFTGDLTPTEEMSIGDPTPEEMSTGDPSSTPEDEQK